MVMDNLMIDWMWTIIKERKLSEFEMVTLQRKILRIKNGKVSSFKIIEHPLKKKKKKKKIL